MGADWDVSGFRDRPEVERGRDQDPEIDWEPRKRRRRFGWPRARRGRFGLITAVVALVVVGAFIWAGRDRADHDLVGEIPMIRADETPIKIPPENPGGMEVPHRDKLVYQRLPGGEPAKVERLLPPPEEPLPAPVTEPAAQSDEPVGAPSSGSPRRETLVDDDHGGGGRGEQETGAIFTQGLDQPAPRPAAPATPGSAASVSSSRDLALQAPKPLTAPQSAQSANPQPRTLQLPSQQPQQAAGPRLLTPQATPSQPSPPTSSQTPAQRGMGGYMVQLVAVSSTGQAQGVWTSLRNRNSDLLGGLSPTFVRADLGAKGSIYRLRAGPIASEERARAMCAELVKRNVDCIIVRPDG